MATALSDYVDIGGECFNVTGTTNSPPPTTEVNTTKTYDLVCKSKTEFEKTFRNILAPGDLRLIRTYLPYQQEQLQGIQEHEKPPLKALIEKRMSSLQESLQNTNQSIKKEQFVKYHHNLKKLLKDIDVAEATTSTTSLDVLQKRVKDKFPKERVYYVLMELAWYLLHPSEIKSNADSWVKLLDTIETLNLGTLVKSIHKTNQHTMKIDVDLVEDVDELGRALSEPDDSAELKQRLESILQLFVTRKYLKAPLRGNAKGPVVNDETLGILKSSLPQPMMGGANNTNSVNVPPVSNSFQINNESMANMMKPFYDFFKQKYDPITSVLSSPLPNGLSLVSLSKLLFICQKITSQSPIQHGVYRITNIDPVMMEFLRTQLGAVQARVKEIEGNGEDVKSFTDMAGLIPVVSITSLLNKFGKSGHYTDPDTIPVIRIMMMGINLEPSKTEMEFDKNIDKEKFDNAVHDVFTDQAIYLVCNEAMSTQTPMNVYDVDYSTVHVSKNTWVATEHTGYFKDYKKPELMLETVMDVNPNIVFNHGMLALSMFIASEELLPK
jgi:hypothetical protein